MWPKLWNLPTIFVCKNNKNRMGSSDGLLSAFPAIPSILPTETRPGAADGLPCWLSSPGLFPSSPFNAFPSSLPSFSLESSPLPSSSLSLSSFFVSLAPSVSVLCSIPLIVFLPCTLSLPALHLIPSCPAPYPPFPRPFTFFPIIVALPSLSPLPIIFIDVFIAFPSSPHCSCHIPKLTPITPG